MFTPSPLEIPSNFNHNVAANIYYRLQAMQNAASASQYSNLKLAANNRPAARPVAAPQYYPHNAQLLQAQNYYNQMLLAGNRFPQQNGALNVKRTFEEKNFDLESLECQKKHFKDNNEDEVQSLTSTQDGDHSVNLFNSPLSKTDSSDSSLNQKNSPPVKKIVKATGSVINKKDKQEKKVVNALFDHEKQKLVFQVETAEGKKAKLTREEVIKEDPMLLLSFYESHLQFSKTLDFNPENLMKVD